MLSYLLLLSFINIIIAFDVPACSSCKWFIANNKGNPDLGLCKLFKYTYIHKGKEMIQHDFSAHCRSSENLCGKAGFLYESINANNDENKDTNNDENKNKNSILNDYDELSNRCCGEVNETDEIEQLEKEFFEIFQRIKKHNKKRIFTASKDLYKLFRGTN
jgi:hypothetical protein